MPLDATGNYVPPEDFQPADQSPQKSETSPYGGALMGGLAGFFGSGFNPVGGLIGALAGYGLGSTETGTSVIHGVGTALDTLARPVRTILHTGDVVQSFSSIFDPSQAASTEDLLKDVGYESTPAGPDRSWGKAFLDFGLNTLAGLATDPLTFLGVGTATRAGMLSKSMGMEAAEAFSGRTLPGHVNFDRPLEEIAGEVNDRIAATEKANGLDYGTLRRLDGPTEQLRNVRAQAAEAQAQYQSRLADYQDFRREVAEAGGDLKDFQGTADEHLNGLADAKGTLADHQAKLQELETAYKEKVTDYVKDLGLHSKLSEQIASGEKQLFGFGLGTMIGKPTAEAASIGPSAAKAVAWLEDAGEVVGGQLEKTAFGRKVGDAVRWAKNYFGDPERATAMSMFEKSMLNVPQDMKLKLESLTTDLVKGLESSGIKREDWTQITRFHTHRNMTDPELKKISDEAANLIQQKYGAQGVKAMSEAADKFGALMDQILVLRQNGGAPVSRLGEHLETLRSGLRDELSKVEQRAAADKELQSIQAARDEAEGVFAKSAGAAAVDKGEAVFKAAKQAYDEGRISRITHNQVVDAEHVEALKDYANQKSWQGARQNYIDQLRSMNIPDADLKRILEVTDGLAAKLARREGHVDREGVAIADAGYQYLSAKDGLRFAASQGAATLTGQKFSERAKEIEALAGRIESTPERKAVRSVMLGGVARGASKEEMERAVQALRDVAESKVKAGEIASTQDFYQGNLHSFEEYHQGPTEFERKLQAAPPAAAAPKPIEELDAKTLRAYGEQLPDADKEEFLQAVETLKKPKGIAGKEVAQQIARGAGIERIQRGLQEGEKALFDRAWEDLANAAGKKKGRDERIAAAFEKLPQDQKDLLERLGRQKADPEANAAAREVLAKHEQDIRDFEAGTPKKGDALSRKVGGAEYRARSEEAFGNPDQVEINELEAKDSLTPAEQERLSMLQAQEPEAQSARTGLNVGGGEDAVVTKTALNPEEYARLDSLSAQKTRTPEQQKELDLLKARNQQAAEASMNFAAGSAREAARIQDRSYLWKSLADSDKQALKDWLGDHGLLKNRFVEGSYFIDRALSKFQIEGKEAWLNAGGDARIVPALEKMAQLESSEHSVTNARLVGDLKEPKRLLSDENARLAKAVKPPQRPKYLGPEGTAPENMPWLKTADEYLQDLQKLHPDTPLDVGRTLRAQKQMVADAIQSGVYVPGRVMGSFKDEAFESGWLAKRNEANFRAAAPSEVLSAADARNARQAQLERLQKKLSYQGDVAYDQFVKDLTKHYEYLDNLVKNVPQYAQLRLTEDANRLIAKSPQLEKGIKSARPEIERTSIEAGRPLTAPEVQRLLKEEPERIYAMISMGAEKPTQALSMSDAMGSIFSSYWHPSELSFETLQKKFPELSKMKYQEYLNLSAAERAKYFKGPYAQIFEEDPAILAVTSLDAAVRDVTHAGYLERVKSTFAQPMGKLSMLQDPEKVAARTAQREEMTRLMNGASTQQTRARIKELRDLLTKNPAVVKEGWVDASGLGKQFEGQMLKRDVYEQARRFLEMNANPTWMVKNGFRSLSALTNQWKWATLNWPASWVRDWLGHFLLRTQHDLVHEATWRDVGKYTAVMRSGGDAEYLAKIPDFKFGQNTMSAQEFHDALIKYGILSGDEYSVEVRRNVMYRVQGNALERTFHKIQRTTEDVAKKIAGDYWGKMLGSPGEFLRQENRVAGFHSALAQGDSPLAAANRVDAALIDYRRVSPFVQALRTTGIMPFATWSSKNLPMQLKLLVERPGTFVSLLHARDAWAQGVPGVSEKDLPEYIQNKFNVVVSKDKDGNLFYRTLTGTLPAADLSEVASPVEFFTQALGPGPKLALEQLLNVDLFTKQQIQKYDGQLSPLLGDAGGPLIPVRAAAGLKTVVGRPLTVAEQAIGLAQGAPDPKNPGQARSLETSNAVLGALFPLAPAKINIQQTRQQNAARFNDQIRAADSAASNFQRKGMVVAAQAAKRQADDLRKEQANVLRGR